MAPRPRDPNRRLTYKLGELPDAQNLSNISAWRDAHVGAKWIGTKGSSDSWIEIRLGSRRTILTRAQAFELAGKMVEVLETDALRGNKL